MAEEVIKIEQLSHFKDKLLEKCDETYQGKLTAGSNITISEDNVISATGGGSGGKTYEGVAPVVVDNTNDQISVNNKELFVQRPLNIAYDENENPVIQADTIKVDYQQITHDDSLVHVSNNAQYALGVNLPVIKQAIFDENSFVYEKTQLNSGNLASGNTYELNRTFTKEGYYPISFDFYANDRQFLMYPRNITKAVGSLYVNGSCTNKYSSSLACTWGIFITWMKV